MALDIGCTREYRLPAKSHHPTSSPGTCRDPTLNLSARQLRPMPDAQNDEGYDDFRDIDIGKLPPSIQDAIRIRTNRAVAKECGVFLEEYNLCLSQTRSVIAARLWSCSELYNSMQQVCVAAPEDTRIFLHCCHHTSVLFMSSVLQQL